VNLPLPRSLRSQTLVVLVAVLATSHLIGIAIYTDDQRNTLLVSDVLDVAERAAATVALLNEIPEPWRREVIRATDSRSYRARLGEAPDVEWSAASESGLDAVERFLDEFLADREVYASLTTTRVERPGDAGRLADAAMLKVAVHLDDGSWLNVSGVVPVTETQWLQGAGIYILSVLAGVVAVGMWLVVRVTKPLTAFARAADQLGKNLRSEALPETGPAEVAQAARAFNEMQSRLRRLVDNRTEMLASISHDLRTPITLLALRAESMPDGDEREKMRATLREMEQMIASLLDFARGAFQDEPNRFVDLTALLDSLCDDLADTGADVSLTAPEHLVYRCRRVSLKRAITNLVDNALKYGGGAEIVVREERGEIVIEVRDRGPGFPSCDLAELFVPFFRAEAAGSAVTTARERTACGVGLGLGIAQAIVHGHGGTLTIGNHAGGGAIARIALPS
jgi:signal transduction histidine kinase